MIFMNFFRKIISNIGNKYITNVKKERNVTIMEERISDKIPYSKLMKMSNTELLKIIIDDKNINYFGASSELFSRLLRRVHELEKEVLLLSGQINHQPRKRKIYYYEDVELTDELLVEYIDNGTFTIYELEKKVGANKNVLRSRYIHAVKRLQALKCQNDK